MSMIFVIDILKLYGLINEMHYMEKLSVNQIINKQGVCCHIVISVILIIIKVIWLNQWHASYNPVICQTDYPYTEPQIKQSLQYSYV